MRVTSVILMSFGALPPAKFILPYQLSAQTPLSARLLRSLGFPESPPLKNPRSANAVRLLGKVQIVVQFNLVFI